jgi:hypothetical protein
MLAIGLREQLGHPRDADGDAPRLVHRERLCLPCFGFVVPRVNIRERLPIGVPDDVTAGNGFGAPGRGKRCAPSAIAVQLRFVN